MREPLDAAPDATGSDRTDAARGAADRLVDRTRLASHDGPARLSDRDASVLDVNWSTTTKCDRHRAMIDAESADRPAVSEPDAQIPRAWPSSARGSPTSAASSGCSAADPRRRQALGGSGPRRSPRSSPPFKQQLDARAAAAPGPRSVAVEVGGYQKYRRGRSRGTQRLQALKPALEDIKSLAGSTPDGARRHSEGAARFCARSRHCCRPRTCVPRTRCSSARPSWPTAPRASGARRCSRPISHAPGTPRRRRPAR